MRRATARDGVDLAFRVVGPPAATAPRIALIHALAMSGRYWDEVVAELASSCALLLIDCRGHGASDRAPGPYDCALFADDLAAVMDEAGWPDAVVAGCSMGGCVAAAFAARHPERTNALLLIDTTARYAPSSAPRWRERAETARRDGMSALVGFQLDRWFTDAFRTASPAAVERCLSIFEANDVECYSATCLMLSEADLRDAVATVTCPTTVVVGELDHATPVAMAADLAGRIAAADLVVLPAAKHFSPVERPGDIASAIRKLLDRSMSG